MKINKEKIKEKLKKIVYFLLNPRLILCLGIAWMITNGWSYILTACGAYFRIPWMTAVGATYMGLLWFPFTPEKILTVIIALFLLKRLFPNDKNTLAVLKKEYAAAKNLFNKHKERRKQKRSQKNVKSLDKNKLNDC